MPNVTNFHANRNDVDWQNKAKSLLFSFDCKITFQKPDGSINKIFCTLNPQQLPVASGKKNARPAEMNDKISIYDIDDRKWKSIPFEKIIDFKVETSAIRSMN